MSATNIFNATKVVQTDPVTGADVLVGPVDTGAVLTLTAQGTGTTNSVDQTNSRNGVKVVVDVTALTGTAPTLTVVVQGKDPASGKYFTILSSTALAAVATTVLTVHPALTAAANLVANDVMPRTFRVTATVAGTTPGVTATVGLISVGV